VKSRRNELTTQIVSLASGALWQHLVLLAWERDHDALLRWSECGSVCPKFFSISHQTFLSLDHTWRRGFVAHRIKNAQMPRAFWEGILGGHFGRAIWRDLSKKITEDDWHDWVYSPFLRRWGGFLSPKKGTRLFLAKTLPVSSICPIGVWLVPVCW
jgi:hypothetical protein